MAKTTSVEGTYGETLIQPLAGLLGRKDHPSEKPEDRRAGQPVALVEGSSPDFTHETHSLLQSRLRLVALLLSAGYGTFFLEGLLFARNGLTTPQGVCLTLLGLTTLIMGVLAFRLCRQCQLVLSHLRGVENLIFGSSALLFLSVGYSKLTESAAEGALQNITSPWLLLMFTYALFIPNSWQRAARFIIPMAFGPLVATLIACFLSPQVWSIIDDMSDVRFIFVETFTAMLFASTLAIGGVGIIRSLRSQAFHAQQLGQYRLKRLLGRGGMGEVYLAEHLMLKRPCAIKLIRPEKAGDPSTLARFEQEVQATARLTHWNTVEIYDFGRTEDGTFYYVMEYLPGMSLDQIVEMHGPLPPERVLHLLVQTCDALAEAHGHCLVHRDIKPANLFAAKRGGAYDVAKLLDFGLVRSLQPGMDLHLTQESMVTGSPLYMSPEQARGDELDHRSDLYALGCTAYFLLTGRPPFLEPSPVKLLLAHATQTPEPPSVHLPGLRADLESVILKCLEKSPSDRFPDVLALRDALTSCDGFGEWSRDCSRQWWEGHGCPNKRHLDTCVSQGLDLPDTKEPSVTSKLPRAQAAGV